MASSVSGRCVPALRNACTVASGPPGWRSAKLLADERVAIEGAGAVIRKNEA